MKTKLCANCFPKEIRCTNWMEWMPNIRKNVDALDAILAWIAKLGYFYLGDGLIRPKIGLKDLYLGERPLEFGKQTRDVVLIVNQDHGQADGR